MGQSIAFWLYSNISSKTKKLPSYPLMSLISSSVLKSSKNCSGDLVIFSITLLKKMF